MFKYASHRGVSGTPTYFMNEIMVENAPKTADDWLKLLQKTYDSQKAHRYTPPKLPLSALHYKEASETSEFTQ